LELQRHTPSKGTKKNLLHSNQAKRQRFKSCFAWNCKGTHQANPQSKIYCTPNKAKPQRIKKRSRLEQANAHTKGNLLHSNQAKRQRVKNCFAWNWQRHTQSKSTKGNLLHLQTGKGSKDKEAVTLGTAKAHTKQTHKVKSIAHQTRQSLKG